MNNSQPTVQPSVSIVVPVYNAGDTIAACIDSLLDQDYKSDRYTITAVDNGSKDRTLEILHGYHGRIKILEESRRGPAAARNLGILSGTDEIIAFMDADCVAEPDWISRLVPAFEDPRVGMAGGHIRAGDTANAIQHFGEEIHDHRKAIETCNPPYVITMNSAVRRTVLAEVGLFDTAYRRAEDVDLSWRIHRAGYALHYVPDAVVYHVNESTLRGLMFEGFRHGYCGVQVKRQHHVYLQGSGRTRNLFGNLRRAGDRFRKYLRREGAREKHLYAALFNGAKAAGGLVGSIRFGYFEM